MDDDEGTLYWVLRVGAGHDPFQDLRRLGDHAKLLPVARSEIEDMAAKPIVEHRDAHGRQVGPQSLQGEAALVVGAGRGKGGWLGELDQRRLCPGFAHAHHLDPDPGRRLALEIDDATTDRLLRGETQTDVLPPGPGVQGLPDEAMSRRSG